MRRQKAEASKREQEWRKLEEEHAHSVTEVKRVNKKQHDAGYLMLVMMSSWVEFCFVCMYV